MQTVPWPERFIDLKRQIVQATPDYEQRLTECWKDILQELDKRTTEIAQAGSDYIPQVKYEDLATLSAEQIDIIRRKGTVVIKDVVDDSEALGWKAALEDFVQANPHVKGFPEEDKQFFMLYWTRSQVQARAHPNVLKASAWLNNLYKKPGKQLEGVDLNVPLVYADRFRIRRPGPGWDRHPPHVDGGSIERWEDESFRKCFADILSGNWRAHDPYELEGRLDARTSLYGRPGQSTVFRTFQGWLAMSQTAPTQGTLRVFPDVMLSNAYTILRPFFSPTVPLDSEDILKPENWVFDISTPDFPGITLQADGFSGPRPTPQQHPHLRLGETMTSVPKVNPGDMVFWHCDVVHSVEEDHTGTEDSAVMYIGAVPQTPMNIEYVKKQAETFLAGINPPDFVKDRPDTRYVGLGIDEDVKEPIARVAMGLPIQVA
ncbi:hypothetical protein AZE42_03385 [Rhizopogon vesiculosus]|uniref:DUF1479 domain protein n=1 Tax=Rhizopogon vesiculosus TaxID=180088 RepID=A0A1J8QGC6_9AGAM|nr:hypothetical protein AZE42_03385 [Rhizopogon vesiculosus]